MAVTHKIYSNIIERIADQAFNWGTETTIKVALLSSPAWNQENTTWASVEASEVSGTNYTAGGFTLTAGNRSIDRSTNVISFKSTDDPLWSNSTINATHAAVYVVGADATSFTDYWLISLIDFDATESSVSGDFKIEWTSDTVFTITVAT